MSIPSFAWALERGRALGLSPAERLVLIYLADKANGERFCFPGQETIRGYTGLALNTIAAVIRKLVERKLIRLDQSPGIVTKYHILREHAPANDEGVAKPNGKVIHSPRKSDRGAPANGGVVSHADPLKSPAEPPQMRAKTPANERDEPYLTKKENLERGACAPEAKAQNLDSGGKEASQPASEPPPAPPAYDPTFTTDEPKADPEAAQQAYAAALRAVRLRNPKRLATKYPANSVDQQLAATQGPPPPPAELKLDPRLAAGVLAARAALAESAAKRWQVAA
jgi:hypothetical protein